MGIITPLLSGNVPDSLTTQRLINQIQSAQTSMSLLQQQISTGQKFQLPSEDPNDAAQAIQLQALLTQNTQFDTNIQSALGLLNSTDSALQSITGAMNTAQGLASSGIGDSSSPQQKSAMALQVQALIQQVVDSANSTFSGRSLFGGSQNTSPPFTIDSSGAVKYTGDQQSLNTLIDS